MPKYVIQIELGPASHYFSIILGTSLNLKPFAQIFDTFASFRIVITMTDLLPSPNFKPFSSRALLINHQGVVFSLIPVEDSILRQSSSIFTSLK